MKDLLLYIARNLVDDPDAVSVTEVPGDEELTLELLSLIHISTLLRAFTRAKGITPYHYLVNLRICAAKRLLEQGASLLEAAMQTGFSDQSHFTNCFSRYIGLTPGAYQEIFTRAEKRG